MIDAPNVELLGQNNVIWPNNSTLGRAVWNTCAAAIPHLLDQGGGSLVNVSSAGAIKGFPLQTPHTAAKYGVVGLTLALANELAAQNVRVNTVLPTGVPTGMVPPSFGPLLGEQRSDLIPIFVNAMPTPAVEPADVSNGAVPDIR